MRQITAVAILLGISMSLSGALVWEHALPVRQGDVVEWNRSSAATADGCMIYVWTGTKRGDRDIYAQKVDASGTILWQQPLLVEGKPFRQANPVISRTTDNNFVIAWWDYQTEGLAVIRAQKITSTGQLLWSQGGIPVCAIPQLSHNMEILADANNGVYIVWTDTRNQSSDIYGQRLDSFGNSLWAVNGVPLANGSGDESYFSLCVDTVGALNIAYAEFSSNLLIALIKTQKFTSDGQFVWNLPILLHNNFNFPFHLDMTAMPDSSVVVTWSAANAGEHEPPYIMAQKISFTGDFDWPHPFVVCRNVNSLSPGLKSNPRIVYTMDNCVIIAWEDFRHDYDYPDIYAQKVNADGQKLWNPDGVPVSVAAYAQRELRLVADGAGGCYIVWEDARNGSYPNSDIYIQHLSSAGTSLWEANGRAVCSADISQSAPMIRLINSQVFIGWLDGRTGSPSLYYQVLNSQGNALLAANGQLIHQGLGGDVSTWDHITLPRTDDVVVIWIDSRRGPLGSKLYFQFVNPDGTVDLEQNGRPLTDLAANTFSHKNPSAVVTPDNKTAIVWEESNRVKAQLIDSNGDRLWGDNGMYLTEAVPIWQKYVKIYFEDGAFYVGWSQLENVTTPTGDSQISRIYGQKIVGGQKQWGANGILVSGHSADNLLFDAQLEQITGRYFIWVRDGYPSYLNIYAKLLNPDGTAAPGWTAAGLAVSDLGGSGIFQISPRGVVTDAGLVVAWLDFRVDFLLSIYGQLISPQGARLWNSSGILLTDNDYEDSDIHMIGGGNSFMLYWTAESSSNTSSVKVQKYNLSGEPLWQQGGNQVSVHAPNNYSNNAYPAVFPNGGMVAAWESSSDLLPASYSGTDIFFRYINPDGSMLGNITGTILTTAVDAQRQPRLAVVGDEAIITWGDEDFVTNPADRCEEIYHHYNLYAQKLSNEVVANEDETIPSIFLSLGQNRPNPFGERTTIHYNLPAKGLATLSIYNIKGQRVKTLLNSKQEKGTDSVTWDGRDERGNACASGVYFYRLTAGGETVTRKLLLMK